MHFRFCRLKGAQVAFLISLVWVTGSLARAAEAIFSKDAGHVFLPATAALTDIDVLAQTSSSIDLAQWVGSQEIEGVALSNSNFVLCVVPGAVWAYDGEKKKCARVCEAPPGARFEDIAYDPKGGHILLKGWRGEEPAAWIVPKGESYLLDVFCRRASQLAGLTYDESGRLFFGEHGDLWSGSIEYDSPAVLTKKPNPDDGRPATLVGYRIAPLATLETYIGTPMQIGVSTVAIAGNTIYAHLHRMGGSGWGNIVRLKKPAAPKETDEAPSDLKERLQLYASEASSVEVLGENGTIAYLCASHDGKRVFYQTADDAGHRFCIVENSAKPKPLSKLNATIAKPGN